MSDVTRASLRAMIADIKRDMHPSSLDLVCRMVRADAERLEIPIDENGQGTFEGVTIQTTRSGATWAGEGYDLSPEQAAEL